MEFSTLNHNRHKVTEFDGRKLTISDVKAILSEAVLAPSAHNIQPWHFAIVVSDEKRYALSTTMHAKNAAQHESAGATIVVYSDTDLTARVHDLVASGDDFYLMRLKRCYYQGFQVCLRSFLMLNYQIIWL